MSDHALIWVVILAGGAITYLLRAAPFMLFRVQGDAEASPWFRFLDYAAFAILGGIVGNALFTSADSAALGGFATAHNLIGVIAVAVTFALYVRLNRPIVCLGIGVALYQLLAMTVV